MIKNNKSFTLIEVLVFVSILALFFVSAAVITTASLRNMQINQHKILAVHYGEEGLEWIKGEKEKNWNAFTSKSGNSGNTYCLNSLSSSSLSSAESCSDSDHFGTPSIFQREATLTTDSNEVKVEIIVKWSELGKEYSVPITTILSVWE